MNIAKINPCDIANGAGVRVVVFVSGCRRHCPGCHNEMAWDFGYGEPFDEKSLKYIRELLKPGYIDGITIMGGEPFEPENVSGVADMVEAALCAGKTVWVYSGYTIDRLVVKAQKNSASRYILGAADVLVDGEYREAERDISLKFRGSRNQRVIDLHTLVVRSKNDISFGIWEGDSENG